MTDYSWMGGAGSPSQRGHVSEEHFPSAESVSSADGMKIQSCGNIVAHCGPSTTALNHHVSRNLFNCSSYSCKFAVASLNICSAKWEQFQRSSKSRTDTRKWFPWWGELTCRRQSEATVIIQWRSCSFPDALWEMKGLWWTMRSSHPTNHLLINTQDKAAFILHTSAVWTLTECLMPPWLLMTPPPPPPPHPALNPDLL